PDHVVVLDRTLIAARVVTGLKTDGWLVLNSPEPPSEFRELFPGRQVATVDATAIAAGNGLGTRTVPIVNTTMFGAVARVLGLAFADVESALTELKFGGANVASARQAFEGVKAEHQPGTMREVAPPPPPRISSLLDPMIGGLPELRTGSWASRRPNRRHLTPPCNNACPAGNDVQAFVAAVAKDDYNGALDILLETSPFPGVCGRVCPAPCMQACNRTGYDESVNVRELERYVADFGQRKRFSAPRRDEAVAVIGSGPAGLSAAYHLARLGYQVTVLEAERELGGVMRTGIPTYRLPRTVLDREIEFIVGHGVQMHTGHRVSRKDLVNLSHRFAAVFVATGLQEARSLDLGVDWGGSTKRIEQGIAFLDRARGGSAFVRGERVVVIGGGNTAIDAARSARRLGATRVSIVYRRSRKEMPAIAEEIDAAFEEGIAIHELVSPVRIRENDSSLSLTCQRMRLGEPDESGRARPVPETTEDAFFDIPCDRVILALGQTPDLSIMPEGSEIRDNGQLLGLAGSPVFCGGDLAGNEGTVSAAIGSGRRTALHIHRTLSGEDLFPPSPEPIAGPEAITTHVFAHAPRRRGGTIDVALRRRTFAEVHTGFSIATAVPRVMASGPELAAKEAARCFSCGVCNSCDRCRQYCPEGIVSRDGDGYRFDYDYCKGCGVCAAQCPRGVIYMAEL
ncbi:MAG: FAD-dependent oxidoreductase, partial [Phycisphaerales bacterium]|nr:FAD-dependent oxidoreductase [Phycisphaerales bacterium]